MLIDNKETKLSIFADDLTAFLEDKASYDNLIKVLKEFETCSGLKVNTEKNRSILARK